MDSIFSKTAGRTNDGGLPLRLRWWPDGRGQEIGGAAVPSMIIRAVRVFQMSRSFVGIAAVVHAPRWPLISALVASPAVPVLLVRAAATGTPRSRSTPAPSTLYFLIVAGTPSSSAIPVIASAAVRVVVVARRAILPAAIVISGGRRPGAAGALISGALAVRRRRAAHFADW